MTKSEFTQDELQIAIDSLKKVKPVTTMDSVQKTSRTCDDTTKEMTGQILDEVMKQEDCTPETWRRTPMKVIYKRKMWKKSEITARFAFC